MDQDDAKVPPGVAEMLSNQAGQIQIGWAICAPSPTTGKSPGATKDPAVAMVAKYNVLPAEALAVDYDSALVSMTEEESVSGDLLRDEVAARAESIEAAKLNDLSKVFDYSIIRRVYGELKKTWKPKLRWAAVKRWSMLRQARHERIHFNLASQSRFVLIP